MGISSAAFARPIEISSTSNTVTFNASAQSLALGTYGSVLSLMYEFKAHMTTAGLGSANVTMFVIPSASNYGKIIISASANFTVTWTEPALATALGFTGDALSGNSSYTGAVAVPSLWLSRYTPSDRETWALDMKQNYAGQLSRTGELVGAATGPDIYHRTVHFDGEPGTNVFRSLQSGTDRTLESFLVSARTSSPVLSTNPATKGFYYFYSVASLATPLASMTSGSVIGWDASAEYVWCYPEEAGIAPPKASHGVTRGYYAFDLRLHTGTAPTWNAP